jgi:hypothetical protein
MKLGLKVPPLKKNPGNGIETGWDIKQSAEPVRQGLSHVGGRVGP